MKEGLQLKAQPKHHALLLWVVGSVGLARFPHLVGFRGPPPPPLPVFAITFMPQMCSL